MHIRHVLALATILCAAATTTLQGQQAPSAARAFPLTSARVGAVSPTGPRLAPRFQTAAPRLAVIPASRQSQAFSGGQQIIVVSTLALVSVLGRIPGAQAGERKDRSRLFSQRL